jgi:hypothetical protein
MQEWKGAGTVPNTAQHDANLMDNVTPRRSQYTMLIGVTLNSHIPYTLQYMSTESQRLSDMHIVAGRPA